MSYKLWQKTSMRHIDRNSHLYLKNNKHNLHKTQKSEETLSFTEVTTSLVSVRDEPQSSVTFYSPIQPHKQEHLHLMIYGLQ